MVLPNDMNNKLTEHLQNSHGEKKRSICDICKGYILVVSLRKNISRFEWLTNQKAKDYFELIF